MLAGFYGRRAYVFGPGGSEGGLCPPQTDDKPRNHKTRFLGEQVLITASYDTCKKHSFIDKNRALCKCRFLVFRALSQSNQLADFVSRLKAGYFRLLHVRSFGVNVV